MKETEFQLLAVHRAPAVSLDAISEQYLGIGHVVARQRAALNTLPFPTFRLTASKKSPIMVKISDLATHIDNQHQAATAGWENSQV